MNSNLPQINPADVIRRQAEQIGNLQTLIFQHEVLAEALRDERDEARAQLTATQRSSPDSEPAQGLLGPREPDGIVA